MTDPLQGLKRFSDPVTVYGFTNENKRIVFLGDVHLPNIPHCKSCELPACATYETFVEALEKYQKETDTELDVFFEGFLVDNMKSRIAKAAMYTGGIVNWAAKRLTGAPLRIYNFRKRLYPRAYFHGDSKRRVHVIDPRLSTVILAHGFNMMTILNGTDEQKMAYANEFRALYPTLGAYESIVRDLCFGKPFRPAFKPRSLLSRGMTKLAKQVYKLPPTQQKLVRSVFNWRFAEIKKDWPLFDNPGSLITNIFQTMCLMMDIYTLGRMLYYHAKQPAGSTTVIMAGALHTYVLAKAMRLWGAPKQLFHEGHPDRVARQLQEPPFKACVKID